jgi:hypothetical protein
MAVRCVKRMNRMFLISRTPISLGWGLILAGSMSVFAQNPAMPQGGEFSIVGGVMGDQIRPSVSLATNGGCVSWQDSLIDKSGFGIGGALLNTSFSAGRIFCANKTATSNQISPKVQLLASNNMIFVWQSSAAGTPDIYARLAAGTVPKGAKTSTEYGSNFTTIDLRLNTYLPDQQVDPAVAALHDGSAIVTWASYGQDKSLWGVFARKVSNKGVCTPAKEFQVNTYTAYNQRKPAVATLTNGEYVIVWVSEQERFSGSVDIYARVFTNASTPVTGEILINSGNDPCDTPDVAPLNDGGFTVVWAQKDLAVPTNSWDIWGRAFTAFGSPEVADFRINTFLYGDQYGPKIAAGSSGSLVVWTSMGEDGSREGVFGRFLQGGTAVAGGEMQVNTTTLNQQMHPAVAWDGSNNFLVVWTSFAGTTGFDLYGQAYTLNP